MGAELPCLANAALHTRGRKVSNWAEPTFWPSLLAAGRAAEFSHDVAASHRARDGSIISIEGARIYGFGISTRAVAFFRAFWSHRAARIARAAGAGPPRARARAWFGRAPALRSLGLTAESGSESE